MFVIVLLFGVSLLAGCNGYVLQGKVIRGSASEIQLVYSSDERLTQPAVEGAEIRVTRDPESLNRHLVGQARSNAGGEFTIIMSEFGTGWMQEKWLVQGMSNGFANADALMELPSKNSKWRLLITLGPGVAEPFNDEDLMQDIEKFK